MSEPTKRILIDAPSPGVYDGVPNEVYRSWNAASNSDLSVIQDYSPMHMRYRRLYPQEPTPALQFGSAVHAAILEPDQFEVDYLLAGQCCVLTGKGSPCTNPGKVLSSGLWYCGVHSKGLLPDEAKTILSADKFDAIRGIIDATERHPAANGLIKSAGKNEVSIVFRHPYNDLLCKARIDMLRPEWDAVGDLKTTECASVEDFRRSITIYGYHRQAAFYLAGLKVLGAGDYKHFAFVSVEKTAPYGVAVYRLMQDAIEAGNAQLEKLLSIYKNCDEKGNFYGYESEFQDISITNWEMRKIINAE